MSRKLLFTATVAILSFIGSAHAQMTQPPQPQRMPRDATYQTNTAPNPDGNVGITQPAILPKGVTMMPNRKITRVENGHVIIDTPEEMKPEDQKYAVPPNEAPPVRLSPKDQMYRRTH